MYTQLSDEDFKYVFERIPRLCVDVVIESKEGILLSERNIIPEKGVWHIPGGTVGKGETLVDAVKRVGYKETGLTIEIIKQLGVIEYLHEDQIDWERHSVSIVFLAHAIGGELKQDFQSSKLMYMKQVPDNMYKGQRDFLKQIFFLK